MRNRLLLPFFAILASILALATSQAYKNLPVLGLSFWGVALASIVIWLVVDGGKIREIFRRKGAKHGVSQSLSVILVMLLALGIGYLSTRERFNKSVDVTTEGSNTLSSESINLIEQLKEKKELIKILAFFQDEGKKAQFRKAISLYQLQGGLFEIEYIDPQTEPTKALAENVTQADTVLFKLGTQEARLNNFSEEKISNAIVKVMKNKEKVVYFISGHGEADLNSQEASGYKLTKAELESERFIVKELNLLESGKIPDDAALLVVAGPKYDLRDEEVSLIEAYTDAARPLMLLVDAMIPVKNFNKLVGRYGFAFQDDLLVIRPDDPRAKLLGQNNAILTEFDDFSPITADFVKRGGVALMAQNSRSIKLDNSNYLKLRVVSLAKSSEVIVRINGVRTESDLRAIAPERITSGIFDVYGLATGKVGGDKVASGEMSKSSQTDLKADNQGKSAKELRVFVGGSSQIVSNLGAQRGENMDLFMNAINYLTQDEDFISIRAKDSSKSSLDLTSATSQFLIVFLAYVYPTLFLGAGVFHWMRRKRA